MRGGPKDDLPEGDGNMATERSAAPDKIDCWNAEALRGPAALHLPLLDAGPHQRREVPVPRARECCPERRRSISPDIIFNLAAKTSQRKRFFFQKTVQTR